MMSFDQKKSVFIPLFVSNFDLTIPDFGVSTVVPMISFQKNFKNKDLCVLPLIKKMLGSGTYGSVYSVEEGGSLIAVKMIPIKRKDCFIEGLNEVQFHRRLSVHSLFVDYYGSDLKKDKLNIKMKRFEGDLSSCDDISCPRVVRKIVADIFIALDYLEKCGIHHRDLKSNNILYDSKTNQIAICDYGGMSFVQHKSVPIKRSRYSAPELLTTTYDHKVDVWSAGFVCEDLMKKIKGQEEDNRDLLRVIKKCKRKADRPSASEILQDPYFDSLRAYISLMLTEHCTTVKDPWKISTPMEKRKMISDAAAKINLNYGVFVNGLYMYESVVDEVKQEIEDSMLLLVFCVCLYVAECNHRPFSTIVKWNDFCKEQEIREITGLSDEICGNSEAIMGIQKLIMSKCNFFSPGPYLPQMTKESFLKRYDEARVGQDMKSFFYENVGTEATN